jgi:hypothetical protein
MFIGGKFCGKFCNSWKEKEYSILDFFYETNSRNIKFFFGKMLAHLDSRFIFEIDCHHFYIAWKKI